MTLSFSEYVLQLVLKRVIKATSVYYLTEIIKTLQTAYRHLSTCHVVLQEPHGMHRLQIHIVCMIYMLPSCSHALYKAYSYQSAAARSNLNSTRFLLSPPIRAVCSCSAVQFPNSKNKRLKPDPRALRQSFLHLEFSRGVVVGRAWPAVSERAGDNART